MAVEKGQKITAADFNDLAAGINKVFSDAFPDAAPPTSESTKLDQEFGWGNIPAGDVEPGMKITASIVNELVDRVNLSAEHVGSEYELDRVISGQKITAALWNDIETVIDDVTPQKNTVALGQTAISELGAVTCSTSFDAGLNFQAVLTFADYDQARYYFNSGSTFKLYLEKSGGDTVDAAWQAVYERMGTVTLGLANTLSTTSNVISNNKGFRDLNDTVQELLSCTSQGGGYGYGYGNYGYGSGGNSYGYGYGYGTGGTKTIKVYGKIVPETGGSYQTGPVKLIIDVTLASGTTQLTTGTHTMYVQSSKAITKTAGLTTFSINSPVFSGSVS